MQEGAAHKLAAAAVGQQTTASGQTSIHTEPVEAPSKTRRASAMGLEFPRFFSTAGTDPFDQVEWELRDAVRGRT